MSNFKKGDKLECIRPTTSLSLGTYTFIEDYEGDPTCVNVTHADGRIDRGWSADRFKLIQEEKQIDLSKFQEGDYIVTLKNDGCCGKINYCSKQKKKSTYLHPVVDTMGNTSNSNSNFCRTDKEGIWWRFATLEEGKEYERQGKPYYVTTLKVKDSIAVGGYYKDGSLITKIGTLPTTPGPDSIYLGPFIACGTGVYYTCGGFYERELVPVTNQEDITWLEACITAGKFVDKITTPTPTPIKLMETFEEGVFWYAVSDLFPDRYYLGTKDHNCCPKKGDYSRSSLCTSKVHNYTEIRLATTEEADHLKACIKAGKYVPDPSTSSKLNVDDIICMGSRILRVGKYTSTEVTAKGNVLYIEPPYHAHQVWSNSGIKLWIDAEIKTATEEERTWFLACEKAGKALSKVEALKKNEVLQELPPMYRVGDRVKCVEIPEKYKHLERKDDYSGRGAGWKVNYTFEIGEVTGKGKDYIVWPTGGGFGVYAIAVELVTQPAMSLGSDVVTYKIGDVVKLPTRRPRDWNGQGKMDMFLGNVVQIKSITGNKFTFNGDHGWNFLISELNNQTPNMYTLSGEDSGVPVKLHVELENVRGVTPILHNSKPFWGAGLLAQMENGHTVLTKSITTVPIMPTRELPSFKQKEVKIQSIKV